MKSVKNYGKKQSNLPAKNSVIKKQGIAVSEKSGKIPAKPIEKPGKEFEKRKGHGGKQKLVFPADSDEDEESVDEDSDEIEDEDEEMSEVSDEDEEESDSEDEQPSKVVNKGTTNQMEASKGTANSKIAMNGKANKLAVEKPAQEKIKPKVAPASDSDEDEDEEESDEEDEEESSEEDEKQTTVVVKGAPNQNAAVNGKTAKVALEKPVQGKMKPQQVAPIIESDEDDEDEEQSDEDEDEEDDEDSSGEETKPVEKKKKVEPTAAKKPVAIASAAEKTSIVKKEGSADKNSRTLFIKGIPPTITNDEIKALHADIIQVNRKQNIAWLNFDTKDAADKAKHKLSQVRFEGESKPLFVDFCDERSSKPAGNKAKHAPNQYFPKHKPNQSFGAKKNNGHPKSGSKFGYKSPTNDDQKTPDSKQFKSAGKAAFKKGTPGKGFTAKAQSPDAVSKGVKRPMKDQGFKKQKKPRL